jgi:hypothetical protein
MAVRLMHFVRAEVSHGGSVVVRASERRCWSMAMLVLRRYRVSRDGAAPALADLDDGAARVHHDDRSGRSSGPAAPPKAGVGRRSHRLFRRVL